MRFLVLILFLASLIGCDAVQRGELKVGASVDAVRSQMGTPESVSREADGREFWDYPRGPEGSETMRLTIGSDGQLKEIVNILTEDRFVQIQNGMNKEQVRQLVGRPGFQRRYGNNAQGNTWEWKYLRDRNTPMLFHVDFDGNGAVIAKGSSDPALSKPQ